MIILYWAVLGILGLWERFDPDVAEAHIIPVFLQLETFVSGAVFDSTVGVFDGHVVVNFYTIPPKC